MEFGVLLTDHQYGFRSNKNTTLAINEFLETIYQYLDQSKAIQTIFLDFSKAFDTVNHQILLNKLPFYNFNESAVNLIKSYLSNRKQYVKIQTESSAMQTITMGVPQGSVLGPLLFLIFINDLVKVSPAFKYVLFADDTNLLSQNPETTQSELLKIHQWCLANKLVINFSKTMQIIFRNPQKTIDQETFILPTIALVQETKFLGIVLDQHCSFESHIRKIEHKISFLLLMFRHLTKILDLKTMINLYYSFIYPHLIYGVEFWGHAGDNLLNRLLICQKKALRIF